jgi:low temperature requirement protein LtrA
MQAGAPPADVDATLEPSNIVGGGERRTTPVELLWDLVFAFAVTRVTTLLSADLSWAGFGHAMLALALVWWAWSAFAWATNAQDPDAAVFRGILLLATVLIFVTGLALPHAFGRDATLFACTYAGVRILHLALYVDASRRGNASLAAIIGFAITVAIGVALLVAGSFASESVRIPLWIAAAAIDYAGPAWLTRERLRGLQRVAVAHFAERYSLFIIICLGESIVAIGIGASGHPLTGESVAAVSLALLITVGLWWIYFDRFAAIAEERLRTHQDPVLAAADAYSYLHLVLVAGIIIFAVGARNAVAHIDGPLSTAARLALCGGVALYLIGHVGFRLRMTGVIHYPELAAATVALAIFPAGAYLAAWATAGAVMLVLALLVVWDAIAGRLRDKRTPHRFPVAAGSDASPSRGRDS